ncbi:MAG: DNA topoisomerase IV, partial [Oscillatoriales cyanobacterium RM1_1_9]|nr:DNA topoisomerase IV [Oscillatoriales cyanobacterium RM1_1_9]
TVVEFSHRGYARRLSPKAADAKSRNPGNSATAREGDDFPVQTYQTTTGEDLIIVMRTGKVYPLKVGEIPATSSRARGTPLITLLPPSALKDAPVSRQELILDHLILARHPEKTDLIALTQQGKIKRLALSELADLTNRGVTIVKLKDDDELNSVNLCQLGEQLILASSGGRLLRFEINDDQLPAMGRTAQGSQATRLRKQEQLVGCLTLSLNSNLLLISEQGYLKYLPLEQVRESSRGAIGTQIFQFKAPKDQLIGMVAAHPEQEVHLLTSENRIIRSGVDDILRAPGDRPFELDRNEKIILVKG